MAKYGHPPRLLSVNLLLSWALRICRSPACWDVHFRGCIAIFVPDPFAQTSPLPSPFLQVGIDVHPTRGLIEPKKSCALTVVIRATRELRLNGIALVANVRGGRQAKAREGEIDVYIYIERESCRTR